ncbi:C-X-C chemokine receptor type 2 [Denticeps clupeoides]|uniref:G-protein coupled receptors family 1 profile domain-containing protein n=1 Tax=Denticeps clupeoides TaxID=299321 RepID=A0AAY4E0E6_9TELE|nr:C-X-C chemokine receptor type 2-like [Denticeps clupeoides]
MTDPNTSFLFEGFEEFYSEHFNYTDYENTTGYDLDEKTLLCDPVSIAHGVNVAVCVFCALIFLVAIPGNVIVGLVIAFNRRVLSPSDVYLFHLVLADLLLALCLPFFSASLLRGWVFGDALCKMFSLMVEISFYSSILFLACISVDRYLVIVWAMEVRKTQRRQYSWVISGAVWFLGVALSLPALHSKTFKYRSDDPLMCTEHFTAEKADEWRLATRLLRQILGFLVPLTIMLVCYGITVARLLRTRGFRRQRAMRVIVAVVVAFLVCWMPYHIAVMADTLLRSKAVGNNCQTRSIVDAVMFATQSLGLMHCCVNPVLYAFVGEKFRKNLRVFYHRRVLDRSSVSRASRSTSQTSDHNSTLL